MERFATFCLTAFGTFTILRPIFHKMKNAGRVILEEYFRGDITYLRNAILKIEVVNLF